MPKRLIIAEKPSLMRTINHALSMRGEHFSSKEDGEYWESEHYVSTSQFGHLLELKMPEEYEDRKGIASWDLKNLPYYPKKYEYNVRKDAKKRFQTIGKLLRRADISEVIHCGDPDREGQILVDLVLREHKNSKPVARPMLKALTDDAIVEAFKTAGPNEDCKNIFNEGMTRMCFDWDFGINLSQYVTLRTNARPALNIGRVIGAIVTEIYNRDVAIENFVPEEYYKVISDIEGGFKLVSKERFPGDEEDKATSWAKELQAGDSVVTNIEEKKVKKRPPKLFSQTSLQAAMSKKYGFKPDKTLDLAQSLYEKGYVSYPRTNTEYIAEDEKDLIKGVIDKINRDGHLAFRDDKSIFDNTKIDGHSAIVVTGKRPEGLADDEKNCYLTILYRFMAVFCKEPCVYNKTIVTIDNPKEQFKATGEVLVQEGWQKFEPPAKKKEEKGDDEEDSERTLPPVKVGDKVDTDFQPVLSETKPPAHYTVTTLGKWMENPFKKEDSTDEEDYKNILAGLEIGTVATRAGILEKAENKGYISIKKKAYRIEPRGRFLVESSKALGIDFSAQMTANMGRNLKSVGRGTVGIMDVLKANRAEITRIINEDAETVQDSGEYGGYGDYTPKEKTEPGIYAPTGESVRFNITWGANEHWDGHIFTEEEIALLLAGEEISFDAVSKKGYSYVAEGTLCNQVRKQKGKPDVTFWGFCLKERGFPSEFNSHVFTEEEKEILLSNTKKEDRTIYVEDLYSPRTKKHYAAYLSWSKKNSKIEMKFPNSSKKRRGQPARRPKRRRG